MRIRISASGLARLLAAGCALCVATVAWPASPAAAPEGPTASVPAALFRALTTATGLEAASELRAELRALWAARRDPAGADWDAECEQANRDSGATPGLIRHPLADGSWLIEVACAQGAYQGSFWAVQVWRPGSTPQTSRAAARSRPALAALLRWPVASERADGATPAVDVSPQVVVWGELGVAARSRARCPAAEIVNRFRAIGDCGTRSRYALRRGTTRLLELAAVFACPETLPGVPVGPADWPPVPLPDR